MTVVRIRIHSSSWHSTQQRSGIWTLKFVGALNFLMVGRSRWGNPNSSVKPISSATKRTSSESLTNSSVLCRRFPKSSSRRVRFSIGFEHHFENTNVYHLDPLQQYGISYDSNKKKETMKTKVFKLSILHFNFFKGRTKFFT
jgi:hypothetical protein